MVAPPLGSRAGMTEGSLTEFGFQRWLPVQDVADWQTGGQAATKMNSTTSAM